MLETQESFEFVLIYGTLTFLLIFAGMLLFIFKFQKRVLAHQKELKIKEEERQKSLLKATIDSQEATQNFIAKELHDGIGQDLATIRLYIHSIKRKLPPEIKDISFLEELKTIVDNTIYNTRQLSHNILPSSLAKGGLSFALQEMLENLEHSGEIKTCYIDQTHELTLASDVALGFYRIAQEATQNVIKYANSETIAIELKFESPFLMLSITDIGKGFQVEDALNKKGIGLKNMQSRAAIIDAEIIFLSKIGQGTSIVLKKKYF